MASRISSSRIVGLSWSKMDSPLDTNLKKDAKKSKKGKENIKYDDVTNGIDKIDEKKRESVKVAANKTAKAFGERILKTINEAETATNTALVKRANMVKSAVTSIKQKLKSSTKRRKRLVTATPSPFKADLVLKTPEGVTRSGRLIRCQDVKMYSPFGFDSPLYNRTPKPKMGLGDSKPKLLLASPEGIGNSLANDLEALANLSDGWSTPGTGKKLTRSKIRTTPRSSRRSMRSKKPLFP